LRASKGAIKTLEVITSDFICATDYSDNKAIYFVKNYHFSLSPSKKDGWEEV